MKCPHCKGEFEQSRKTQKYCSKRCMDRAKEKRYVKRQSLKGIRRKRTGRKGISRSGYYREIILSVFDDKCSICGKDENLKLHHIIPVCLGGKNKTGNITALCDKCHTMVHKEDKFF